MTVIHIFWNEGSVTSYTFANKRVVYIFLDEIKAFDDAEFGRDSIVCKADLGTSPPVRPIARRFGATRRTLREKVKSGRP